jgi:hypothetical protein
MVVSSNRVTASSLSISLLLADPLGPREGRLVATPHHLVDHLHTQVNSSLTAVLPLLRRDIESECRADDSGLITGSVKENLPKIASHTNDRCKIFFVDV